MEHEIDEFSLDISIQDLRPGANESEHNFASDTSSLKSQIDFFAIYDKMVTIFHEIDEFSLDIAFVNTNICQNEEESLRIIPRRGGWGRKSVY